MAKKKSNTGMIIAIIISVIVVGIVVWGFLTKWKFIGDGKSTEKAKAKAKAKKEVQDIKVIEVTPEMEKKNEKKMEKIQQRVEKELKSMSEEELKQKLLTAKKEVEKQLNGFRIIEHMTEEKTNGSSTPKTCEFTDTEIESVIAKFLGVLKLITYIPNAVLPKLVKYYKRICQDETTGAAEACTQELGYEFNPHTLGLYSKLDLIKPPEGGEAGFLYGFRYVDLLGTGPLFSTADKQEVGWSNEPESKEIRLLYKLYKALKACPAVQAPPAPPGACDDSSYTATDSYGDGCSYYQDYPGACGQGGGGHFDTKNFKAKNCCACKFKHRPGEVVYSDKGFDLEVLEGSLAECKQKCDSNTKCVAFVFDKITKNKCWLKKATNKSGESLNDSHIESGVGYDLYMKNT